METKLNISEFKHFFDFTKEIYSIVNYLENKSNKSELDKRIISFFRELESHIDTDDIKNDSKLRLL